MDASALRHLAVIAGDGTGSSGAAPDAVADALSRAAALATEAFARVPELRAFSFHAPAIDRLLADPASGPETLHACVSAAALLADAAARRGAALRLCGRTEGLPPELTRHAPQAAAGPADRTLIWFLRYGGRDEIARAASRFLLARPASPLADEDLDAWLDTAGVPDPDLIVLAGGPFEAHDTLVWQGSYAELWHTEKPWPAFSVEDLGQAITAFHTRQRRFGG